MRFPEWVSKPKHRQASNRLRFILNSMAVQTVGRASMRAFGDSIGIDHSTLSCHIRDGKCSARTAMLLVDKLGDSFVTARQLCDPLSIKTD